MLPTVLTLINRESIVAEKIFFPLINDSFSKYIFSGGKRTQFEFELENYLYFHSRKESVQKYKARISNLLTGSIYNVPNFKPRIIRVAKFSKNLGKIGKTYFYSY